MEDPITTAGIDAPAVVTVTVLRNPSPTTGAALAALAAQTYPTLAHLVMDASNDPEVPAAVGTVLPGALVRPVEAGCSWADAVNPVQRLVEGAVFYAVLDEHTVLEPGAIDRLVEEAFRSNAAIAGPKIVELADPARIVSVGCHADRFGHLVPIAEPGERDQEQHDAVRDVFVIERGCQLIRADLFATMGGFDADLDGGAEALDLCWRAHLAGGRVLVVPAARARRDAPALVPEERQRLRTTFVNTGRWQLPRVVVTQLLMTVVAVVAGFVSRHPSRSVAALRAWTGVLGELPAVVGARRRVAPLRVVPDREVRNLLVGVWAHLASLWRDPAERGTGDRLGGLGARIRRTVVRVRSGGSTASIATWLVGLALLAVGSRKLISGRLPVIGSFVSMPGDPDQLLETYARGWTSTGLGSTRPPPTGLGLLGLWDQLLPGGPDAARLWAVLAAVVAGWVGMWKLCRLVSIGRTGQRVARAMIAGTVTYAALPLAANAIGSARVGGVVAYGALPWIVAALLDGGRVTPAPTLALTTATCRAGVVGALAMAFVPMFPVVIVALALAIGLGALIGRAGTPGRSPTIGIGAAILAGLLNLPWSWELARPEGAWSQLGAVKMMSAPGRGIDALVRFDTGPIGVGLLGFGVVGGLVFVVVVARGWRATVASALAAVAIAFVAVAWVADRFVVPFPLPSVEVLLAPVAVAVAVAAALGVTTFAHDVDGTAFSLVRQPLAGAAAIAAVVAMAPGITAVADGRWELPRADFARSLGSLAARPEQGEFRVLWLGDPRALPAPSWWLADGVGWVITDGLVTPTASLWPGAPTDVTMRARQAVNLAGAEQTDRLGRLLGTLGIRYVVVPRQSAPAFTSAPVYEPPASLVDSLVAQLDLRRVELDDAAVVFENTAWVPVRAVVALEGLPGAEPAEILATPPIAADPVLEPERIGQLSVDGRIGPGALTIGTPSQRWELTVDGRRVERSDQDGALLGVHLTDGGEARLELAWSTTRLIVVGAQTLAWGVVFGLGRRRETVV